MCLVCWREVPSKFHWPKEVVEFGHAWMVVELAVGFYPFFAGWGIVQVQLVSIHVADEDGSTTGIGAVFCLFFFCS